MQLNGIKRQSCKGFNYFGSVLNIEVMAHISCEHITCSIPYSHWSGSYHYQCYLIIL